MDFNGISIEKLNHACFKLKGSRIIYIDPFQIDNQDEKADILFITHAHQDHCNPIDVQKVISKDTVIITVADCQSKLSNLDIKGKRTVNYVDFKKGERLARP